ncbi:MAG: HAMP domain-containing sensor histidine kinase [Oligoflexia bacterium]|nr:HAMP domain-containing sensor histidine kinase [Oligoflexia bacterium]
MKSKTRPISKSSRTKTKKSERVAAEFISVELAEGCLSPGPSVPELAPQQLAPHDEALVRAFQSNLLSLISHELRTPLTGILNALGLLDENAAEGSVPGFSRAELVKMARQNAQRLHRTLVTLLDLAAVESGTFAVKLREIELVRMVRSRLAAHASMLRDQSLELIENDDVAEVSILGDPGRLTRALDLSMEVLVLRARKGVPFKVRISSAPEPQVEMSVELAEGSLTLWDEVWSHALAGFEGGTASPSTAFAGVLQSEQAFLSRTEEGLGSGELLLVHEVMHLHHGSCAQKRKGNVVTLTMKFPSLSSDDAVAAVLTSRTYELTSEPSAVTLVLIRVPREQSVPDFCSRIKELLYRVTDGAYPLLERREVALVLDDYKKSDIGKLLERIERSLMAQLNIKPEMSFAHCPEDVADPRELVERARSGFAK